MEGKSKKTGIPSLDKTICKRSYGIRNGFYRVLIFFLLLLTGSCTDESPEIRILFTGDVLLSRNVKEEYSSRKTFPWEKLEPLFHSADLVIGNLEGAVGAVEKQLSPITELPVFAIDSNDIVLLKTAGFNAMTIENNHVLDLGPEGKTRTILSLVSNNIKPVSFENSPNFIHIKDQVIAVISMNLVKNRDSSKYRIPSIELKRKFKLAKSLSNLIIVSVHWGSELLEWPNKEQRDAAQWLIANGADVIIGHHPHVIQQPELVDGKPVFFSLGNHLFDQKYPATKEGLIAEIRIKNGKFTCCSLKTRTQKNSFYPETNEPLKEVFKPIKCNDDLFTVDGYTLIPYTIDIENKIILQAFQNNRLVWKSHPMSLVALQKTKIDGKNEHLFALESYYSSIDKEISIRPYVYRVDDKGIVAKWRGSALAWPILDARISPVDDQILCALHRGDAFIAPGYITTGKKIVAYKWNGFGFDGLSDSLACECCKDVFNIGQ